MYFTHCKVCKDLWEICGVMNGLNLTKGEKMNNWNDEAKDETHNKMYL